MFVFISKEFEVRKSNLERELREYEAQRRLYSEAGLRNLENHHPTFALDAYRLAAKYDMKVEETLKKLGDLAEEFKKRVEANDRSVLDELYEELGIKRIFNDTKCGWINHD